MPHVKGGQDTGGKGGKNGAGGAKGAKGAKGKASGDGKGKGGAQETCRNFLAGRCTKGASCRFLRPEQARQREQTEQPAQSARPAEQALIDSATPRMLREADSPMVRQRAQQEETSRSATSTSRRCSSWRASRP